MSSHNRCGLCHVEIKNLSVKDGKDILLENVNLTLSCGELTALIGKNGAGKTTLIRSILGERHYTGNISYTNHKGLTLHNPKIGYVPQHLLFDKSSPVSVLDFFFSCIRKRPVWLGHKSDDIKYAKEKLSALKCEDIIYRRLGDLSGGELQRLMLCVAIEPMPDILILDEPVSGVDNTGLEIFYNTVTSIRDEFHIPILLVSHDLGLIGKYADSVAFLDKTIIKQGSAKEVFSCEEFKKAFSLNILEVTR